MKLDNHGWGLREMIIYSCIILFLLFFAAFLINDLYEGIKVSKGNNSYYNTQNNYDEEEEEAPEEEEEPEYENDIIDYTYYEAMEREIKRATIEYVRDYNYDLEGQILKVSVETLVGLGYMEQPYDQTLTEKCTGYSNVYLDESTNEYNVKSYIGCSTYRTEGY